MSTTPCFGIDLGTSCSAIAWVNAGVPCLIPIEGRVLMPSVVVFPPDRPPLVGAAARNSVQAMPERAVVSSKRKMGTDHVYDIEHDGRRVTPVDAAAMILRALIAGAEAETGVRPQRAVITVPAWFTQAQRADTRRAGTLAGLDVARIINEPTAAALAHAHGADVRRRALVFDLGGGTFDVSLVEQDGPVVEVRASHGDSELGGDDIDVLLRDRVLRKLDQSDPAFVDAVAASPGAMLRLKLALEDVKIALSEVLEAPLSLPFLATVDGAPRHLEAMITRTELDLVANLVLSRTTPSVDQVLLDAGVTAEDVDELLLVGGSTQLPQTWHLLRERYGLEGSHAIPPRHAVALGAAIQGAIIDGSRTDGVLADVAPYSLSVGVADPRASTGRIHFISRVITPRNAPLPSRHTEVFYASSPDQRTFQLPVFQGAHGDPRENVFLGTVVFHDLPSPPPGVEDRAIHVEFTHDLDGLVEVRVKDTVSGLEVSGRLAADGAEQANERAAWLERMTRNRVIFGEGDALEEDAPPEARAENEHAHRAELAKARALFAQVTAAAAAIRAEAPGSVDELLTLAARGAQLIADDADPDDIVECQEDLEDAMFDAGVYL